MSLLAAGVPLSLLWDLADPDGPDSAALYRSEAPSPVRAGQATPSAGRPPRVIRLAREPEPVR